MNKKKMTSTIRKELQQREIFSILPEDMSQEYYELYLEYEQAKTIESKIAK
jgi:hypothetical protein